MSDNPGHSTLLVLSDIHYAGEAERALGYQEYQVIRNPFLQAAVRAWRYFIWMRHPHAQNHWLDKFLAQAGTPDYVIAVGDYSCDAHFVGVSNDASCESARECLNRLRQRFGDRFLAAWGDHEVGKMSLFGGVGGMRLASWQRAQAELGLQPFWQVDLGQYRLLGVVSSLIALPVYEPESLPSERRQWQELRANHLAKIDQAFASLQPAQRVLLFCHDPTALPFLWQQEAVRRRLDQVEQTFIGHLHSNLIFWKSRLLAGMPAIGFLGNSIRRMSTALHEARHWRPFKVRLCPALAGIQLLKDGGYYVVRLHPPLGQPPDYEFRRLDRRGS